MRPYILRALLAKEFHRHLANRGGLALCLLLVAAAVLLSVFNPGGGGDAGATGMVGGVHHCFIEYAEETPLVDHLRKNIPDGFRQQLRFRKWTNRDPEGLVTYPPGVGAIHLRLGKSAETGRPVTQVQVWHPQGDPGAMAPYEQWFWKEARRAFHAQAAAKLRAAGADAGGLTPPEFGADDLWAVRESFRTLDDQIEAARKKAGVTPTADVGVPELVIERQGLGGKVLDFRSAIATGMVVFALYFACVYLLPTLNCEERERGVLLAQALSPASPVEILAAKFLFYPVLGIGLAAILAGIYKPAVLSMLFFWLSLLVVAAGFLGIGMTVATLAKTQRAAFMGAMCYLLSVSLILFICSTNGIPVIPYLAVEYHGPRILHAALSGEVQAYHWLHLLAAAGLAGAWMTAAGWLFRRRGWQ
jgi:hypothetical protein